MFRYLLSFFLFSGGGHIDQNGISDYNVKKKKKKKKSRSHDIISRSHNIIISFPRYNISFPRHNPPIRLAYTFNGFMMDAMHSETVAYLITKY